REVSSLDGLEAPRRTVEENSRQPRRLNESAVAGPKIGDVAVHLATRMSEVPREAHLRILDRYIGVVQVVTTVGEEGWRRGQLGLTIAADPTCGAHAVARADVANTPALPGLTHEVGFESAGRF